MEVVRIADGKWLVFEIVSRSGVVWKVYVFREGSSWHFRHGSSCFQLLHWSSTHRNETQGVLINLHEFCIRVFELRYKNTSVFELDGSSWSSWEVVADDAFSVTYLNYLSSHISTTSPRPSRVEYGHRASIDWSDQQKTPVSYTHLTLPTTPYV